MITAAAAAEDEGARAIAKGMPPLTARRTHPDPPESAAAVALIVVVVVVLVVDVDATSAGTQWRASGRTSPLPTTTCLGTCCNSFLMWIFRRREFVAEGVGK